jgi:hypothetical protein
MSQAHGRLEIALAFSITRMLVENVQDVDSMHEERSVLTRASAKTGS